jgi:hypothetical protein
MLVVISAMVSAGSMARDLLRWDWRNDNPARVAAQSSAQPPTPPAPARVMASRNSGGRSSTWLSTRPIARAASRFPAAARRRDRPMCCCSGSPPHSPSLLKITSQELINCAKTSIGCSRPSRCVTTSLSISFICVIARRPLKTPSWRIMCLASRTLTLTAAGTFGFCRRTPCLLKSQNRERCGALNTSVISKG